MGVRGPQPKPSAQKEQEGTFRPDRATPNEPKYPIGVPVMPLAVKRDPHAKRCWDYHAPWLVEAGVLSPAHSTAFEAMCFTFSNAMRAQLATSKGPLVKHRLGGVSANPAFKMAKDAWAEYRQYLAHFGISPASASRVNGSPAEQSKDPAEG